MDLSKSRRCQVGDIAFKMDLTDEKVVYTVIQKYSIALFILFHTISHCFILFHTISYCHCCRDPSREGAAGPGTTRCKPSQAKTTWYETHGLGKFE